MSENTVFLAGLFLAVLVGGGAGAMARRLRAKGINLTGIKFFALLLALAVFGLFALGTRALRKPQVMEQSVFGGAILQTPLPLEPSSSRQEFIQRVYPETMRLVFSQTTPTDATSFVAVDYMELKDVRAVPYTQSVFEKLNQGSAENYEKEEINRNGYFCQRIKTSVTDENQIVFALECRDESKIWLAQVGGVSNRKTEKLAEQILGSLQFRQ